MEQPPDMPGRPEEPNPVSPTLRKRGRPGTGLIVLLLVIGAVAAALVARDTIRRHKHAGTTIPRIPGCVSTVPERLPPPANPSHHGLDKIQHLIFIMQENRSFDQYFGTYPGADGLPVKNGQFTVGVPDPKTMTCVAPFHDSNVINNGGPHGEKFSELDVDHNRMDGFLTAVSIGRGFCNANPYDPGCAQSSGSGTPDAMSYHDAREIPNYWAYANNFVLQDHMFESTDSWSLPSHLFMVSGWSATCARANDPMSCKTDLAHLETRADPSANNAFAWTDITYLLAKAGVSWGYYVAPGTEPDCANGQMTCAPVGQSATTPNIWNPLPNFTDVKQDGQLGNISTTSRFLREAANGTLPQVSWVVPSGDNSEHPPSSVAAGQAYVTNLVNTVMRGRDWSSTAIFISWDDWGGFYDHVPPPKVDGAGWGMRVPGLMISPYARRGYIDHQPLSFDAYLKLIEARFLGGQALDPKTDGRPDSRPDVREHVGILGDLVSEFDFKQRPQPPLLLPTHPPPGPASMP